MRKLTAVSVPVIAVFAMANPTAALATNSHQDHQGACARSTTSISKGLGDLKYNKVLTKFAKSLGVKAYNGNITKQMSNQLTVGTVASATSTDNRGCDGHGHTFPVGKRALYKGEKVIVKTPAMYGKDVCNSSHSGCTSVTITVHAVLPGSCWNLNTGPVKVKIWVKKTKKPSPGPQKPVAQPTQGCVTNSATSPSNSGTACQGNNSSQTAEQTAKQTTTCGDNAVNSCNTYQVTYQSTTQVNANCSKVVVGYSDGSSVTTYKDANGNETTEQYCSSQTENPPPTCPAGTTGTPPNCVSPPPTDHAPQISCVYPPHVYVNGSVYIWCEASDPDGDALSVNVVSNNTNGHIAGTIPSDVRWDASACPSGVHCYRTTYWGDVAGTNAANVTATVTANGKSGTSSGMFTVLADAGF